MNPAPLAKAKAPTRLPGETPLFQPPSHLHAEKRTDKLGRTITRWVNRERPEKAEPVRVLDAPTQPKPKPRRSPPPRRATGAPTPTPPKAPKHDQPDMFKHAPKVDPKARATAMRHDGPLFDNVRREEQRKKPRPPGAARPLPSVTEQVRPNEPPKRINVTADVKNNTAVLQHEGSDVTWRVPRASLRQHLEEMGGRIEARRPPSNPHLRSVMNGTAKLLGRGNDGIVWSTGNKVVKMGGVTPYHRGNHHAYRTPAEARERIQAEHDIGQAMRAAGVTGVPDSEYVEHEGRGYLIRDHLRIPDKLTLPQLRQVERHIASMHAAGFTLNDLPQFGVNRKGEMEHYDLGTATSLEGANEATAKYRIDGDLDNLGLLFQKHGHEYEPEVGHGLRRHLDYATGVSLFTPKDAPLELREKRARNIAEAYQRFAKVNPKDDEARREAADAIKELGLDPGRYIVEQPSISDRVGRIMAKAIGPNLHKELRVVVRKDGAHTQNYWVGQEQPSLFPDLTGAPAADEPAPPPAPTPDPLTMSTPADNDGGGGSTMSTKKGTTLTPEAPTPPKWLQRLIDGDDTLKQSHIARVLKGAGIEPVTDTTTGYAVIAKLEPFTKHVTWTRDARLWFERGGYARSGDHEVEALAERAEQVLRDTLGRVPGVTIARDRGRGVTIEQDMKAAADQRTAAIRDGTATPEKAAAMLTRDERNALEALTVDGGMGIGTSDGRLASARHAGDPNGRTWHGLTDVLEHLVDYHMADRNGRGEYHPTRFGLEVAKRIPPPTLTDDQRRAVNGLLQGLWDKLFLSRSDGHEAPRIEEGDPLPTVESLNARIPAGHHLEVREVNIDPLGSGAVAVTFRYDARGRDYSMVGGIGQFTIGPRGALTAHAFDRETGTSKKHTGFRAGIYGWRHY